ncbi:hypothetical protein K3495_g3997 [Podosphaera aphanis]|nr:hypothetical protein K3495_g3997 [Podosphaera aphanis]
MDDERQVELDCLASIFPELQTDPHDPFSFTLTLPVHPKTCVKYKVLASTGDDTQLSGPCLANQDALTTTLNPECPTLSFLPPLHVRVTLPEGYPFSVPPEVQLSLHPQWLSDAELYDLKANEHTLWEEAGGGMIVYSIIDSFQQAAENAFGYASPDKILEIPEELRISLLDFDSNEAQLIFHQKTFDCSICLEPKKGALCHQMLGCKHVFCVQCLQDFYHNAIHIGDLTSVRCLAPNCAQNSKESQQGSRGRPKIKTLGPSELLQIPLERDMVTRYVKLKYKLELESDKNTVYCPRTWCQGAAKSKKHRKPVGLEDETSEGEESEAEKEKSEVPPISTRQDLLSVCEDCSFAFCARCFQSWHGEFTLCIPKTSTGEMTEEEKASLEYLLLHTTPCPTCSAPSQKTHGCNHMICFKCHTHFCYLCSAWLAPTNPYKHYNEITTGCYMRLWELEGGDGDDVGLEYAGGRRERANDNIVEELPEIVLPLAGPPPAAPARAATIAAPRLLELQREGPLVLRINQIPGVPQAPAV